MISSVILLILSFGSLSFFTNVNGSESKIESLLEAREDSSQRPVRLHGLP